MLNSEKFLASFSKIENYLRNLTNGDKQTRFYTLVDKAKQSNSIVRSFEYDLKEYADLRNAIVHERKGGDVIAEPNEFAVSELENIESKLLKPTLIFPLFKRTVTKLEKEDPLSKAVSLMWANSYSQLPIFSNKYFFGLLTSNTISRWLGKNASDDLFSLEDTTIEQVLQFTEEDDNHSFLKKNDTVYDAIELFQQYETQGKRLDAILITENGKSTETIIGIITVSDLPRAYQETNL